MSLVQITLDAVVVASSEQVHRKLGDEAVILGLSRGTYYGLDEVGLRVWELLQQPVGVSAIRDRLLAEYEVDPARCEEDLLAFLGELLEQQLIELQPPAR